MICFVHLTIMVVGAHTRLFIFVYFCRRALLRIFRASQQEAGSRLRSDQDGLPGGLEMGCERGESLLFHFNKVLVLR